MDRALGSVRVAAAVLLTVALALLLTVETVGNLCVALTQRRHHAKEPWRTDRSLCI